jgi:hypothetical protein
MPGHKRYGIFNKWKPYDHHACPAILGIHFASRWWMQKRVKPSGCTEGFDSTFFPTYAWTSRQQLGGLIGPADKTNHPT